MRISLFVFLLVLGFHSNTWSQNTRTISGYIKEKGSKEALIGVTVRLENSNRHAVSNTYGFYSISLPANQESVIVFSMVGYQATSQKIFLDKNLELDLELESKNLLEELVVSARKQENRVSETPQMSKIDLPVSQIRKIPTLLGEKDVLKVLQLMPGVQKGSEGQSGLYVRGGGPDQNLIILDDAIVYNANHLFGFFSTFNGDALKSVELTKGGFPARYGGRLSSVIDLNMKDGNKEKFTGEGGIGIISSRLTLEGPIKKNKSSFLVSGRRTYIDVISQPFIKARQKGLSNQVTGGYFFYDLNAKINYELGRKDKLYLSSYFGNDNFSANISDPTTDLENGIKWGNQTATFRWNHLFNQKLFANTSLIFSKYDFGILSKNTTQNIDTGNKKVYELNYSSGIRDWTVKYDLDYFMNPQNQIKFGLQSIFHRFTPSATVLSDENINLYSNKIEEIDVNETGFYVEDIASIGKKIKINGGLRLSLYTGKGKTYTRLEPRISASYTVNSSTSVKGSYALMNQFVHLLSNSSIGLPTDLWVPTTDKIPPQQSIQYAAGIAKDIDKQGLTLTLEGYYKKMKNIISYKEGASFLVIDNPENQAEFDWQSQVTTGQGWSYGFEILLQKKIGKFSGWTGYTWSKTEWQFDELNFGNKFFPKYDRRHDISIVGIYELSKKITLSATWVYGTGNALTVPVSEYTVFSERMPRNAENQLPGFPYFGSNRVNEYSARNAFRAENYHRLDAAVQFHKKKKRHERTWEIGVYNAYNRRNPFFYITGNSTENSIAINEQNQDQAEGQLVMKRYSLFPIVPSVSYSFKF